jgi:hypothetical protein
MKVKIKNEMKNYWSFCLLARDGKKHSVTAGFLIKNW